MNDDHPTDVPAIAVVGMAGRFPGARDVAGLWDNLCRGVESIRRLTPEEMRAAGVDPARLADPRWVPAAGVLDGSDLFDAAFFQIPPREAELLDPQHRVFLECAWEALEDAACDPSRFAGAIGVFAGAGLNTYLVNNLLPGGESVANPQVTLANDKDFLTTRLSYKLDLKGPSLDVQTGCSTSLVSVVVACQSLLNFQCDLALAGGVAVREPQRSGYLYQENGILSPDGHCRPFDAQAAGTVPGNGVGVVVLKRLEDALADGDSIRAVILGAAINNDGAAKVGFTAPGVAGQAEVVGTALAIAGLQPEDISYIETHGTATPKGDPIEIRALDRVFRQEGSREAFCALGALKSNLGHLDAAAGVAGLIKTVLALEHRQIPPTLHFAQPHPEAGLEGGPFYVNAELRTWDTDALPRRAGVSSFGIGGTNAHVVLEEAPPRPEAVADDGPELLILSARTAPALEAATARLARHLKERPEIALRDVAHTLRVGRKQMDVRRAVVVRDRADAVTALADPQRLLTAEKPQGDVRVAFLFPGQGAQHAGMAAGLYEREPVFREALEECRGIVDLDLDPERLNATEVTQPVLFAVEYALARLWQSWGVQPAAFLGHSLGEYVAACLAGVFSLEAALRLVVLRGRLMQSLPTGAMLSVSLAEEDLRPLLDPETEIAAVNAHDRCVAAGPPEAVERLRERLAARGVEARLLPVERAFHTRDVEAVLPAFVEEVRRARPAAPQIPYLSNVTGTWVTKEQATDPAFWGEHLRRTVRFADGVRELGREAGWVLIEVGPGQTLTSLVRRQGAKVFSSLPARNETTPPHETLLAALGRLWLAGGEVDWTAVRPGGRRVPLPTYPFERQRFWVEPATSPAAEPVGLRLRTPLWRQALPSAAGRRLAADNAVWLVFPDASGIGSQLLQRLQAERLEPVSAVSGPGFSRISTSSFTVDPGNDADYDSLLEAVLVAGRPLRVLYLAETGLEPLAAALRRRETASVRLDVVVTGAVEPSGGAPGDPGKAALLGTCRGLSAAGVSCRVVDILPPPANAPAEGREMRRLVDQIQAEIAAPVGDETVVALRGRRRWVEAWEEVPATASAPDRTREGSWLVTGDLGEPGRELARLLAARSGVRVTVQASDESPWTDLGRWMEGMAGQVADQGGASQVAAATDALCTSHVVAALRSRGIEPSRGAGLSLAELRQRLSLAPGQERLFEALLRMLRDDGVLEIRGEEVRFLRDAGEIPSPAEARHAGEARAPQLRGLFDLLDHCGRHLAEVLSGEMPGLSVLYPEGSSDELARAVQAAESEGPQDAAPLLLREILRKAQEQNRPLRILEVGGGQGTLTRELLPVLGSGVEYWFTDVGRSFVLAAERTSTFRPGAGSGNAGDAPTGLHPVEVSGADWGVSTERMDPPDPLYYGGTPVRSPSTAEPMDPPDPLDYGGTPVRSPSAPERQWPSVETPQSATDALPGATPSGRLQPPDVDVADRQQGPGGEGPGTAGASFSRMRFGVLDITRDPSTQGFPLGFFDAVLGANVVHATPRIAETLDHLRALLAPGGLLALMETVRRQRWADLVWGLTEGWWSFADAPLRTESPLLSADAWIETFGRTGFQSAQSWPRGEDVETALLLARKPSAAEPVAPRGLIHLTRDPAALPALAAAADEHMRRTDGLATALLQDGEATGDDLALAVDRALEDGLLQVSVSRGAPVPLAEAAGTPEPSPVEIPAPQPSALHGRPQLMTPFVAPRTDEERAIAEIWQRALGIERIGVHDNFLELGGDSLIGLQVVYAIRERFPEAGSGLSLYEHPTVATLAGFVTQAGDSESAAGDTDPFELRSTRGERRRELRGSYKRTNR